MAQMVSSAAATPAYSPAVLISDEQMRLLLHVKCVIEYTLILYTEELEDLLT